MKKILLLSVCGATLAVVAGSPAAAIAVVNGSCASIASAHGCHFNGLITASNVSSVQSQFNLYNNVVPSAGSDITLSFLFKSDDVGFPGVVTGHTGGTWSVPGYHIKYFAVNAGPDSVLYKLTPQASSGVWSTADIPHGANLREVRDLVFFGSVVPEPGVWAMMIAGFGLVGLGMRRRPENRLLRQA